MKTWYLTPKGVEKKETKITEPVYAWVHQEETPGGRLIPYMVLFTKSAEPQVGDTAYLLVDGKLRPYTDRYGSTSDIKAVSDGKIYVNMYGYQWRSSSRDADFDTDILVSTEITYRETNGNDVTTEYGVIKQVTGLEALRVRIDAALQVFKGELQDQSLGVEYFGVMFSGMPLQLKLQELSRVILKLDGVNGVDFESASTSSSNELNLTLNIKTDYGELTYNRTFENIV